MKALPKRKGNLVENRVTVGQIGGASMKAPPHRKGNRLHSLQADRGDFASMKALPKRKGNLIPDILPRGSPRPQ
mgnify:CR=1 FL=1